MRGCADEDAYKWPTQERNKLYVHTTVIIERLTFRKDAKRLFNSLVIINALDVLLSRDCNKSRTMSLSFLVCSALFL